MTNNCNSVKVYFKRTETYEYMSREEIESKITSDDRFFLNLEYASEEDIRYFLNFILNRDETRKGYIRVVGSSYIENFYKIIMKIINNDDELLNRVIDMFPAIVGYMPNPSPELQMKAVMLDHLSVERLWGKIAPEVVSYIAKTSAKMFFDLIYRISYTDDDVREALSRGPAYIRTRFFLNNPPTAEMLSSVINNKKSGDSILKYVYENFDISILNETDRLFLEIKYG